MTTRAKSGLEPAHSTIELFGGAARLARALNVTVSAVAQWRRPKGAGGTGGQVPYRHHEALYELAERRELPLSSADLDRVAYQRGLARACQQVAAE